VTAADALLAGLADGLRRRVAERSRAEERLADFVFSEGADGPRGGALLGPADWRHFVSRTLAAAGAPGTLDLLDRLSRGDVPLDGLTADGWPGLPGSLAIVDRVGDLTAAGLVRRDLETGRVGLTDLGTAVLALAREWEHRAVDAAEGDAPGPT
jgi:hypothetical protein